MRLPPPHRAAATAPNSLGPKTMMRPPNLAAGQPARLPSPRQQQQHPPPPPPPETEEACRNRVYARLIAEMKLQKAQQDSAARAGQQRIGQTASAQPACFHDEGGDRPAGAEAMVSPAQFPSPHGGCPYSSSNNNLAQRHQRQRRWKRRRRLRTCPLSSRCHQHQVQTKEAARGMLQLQLSQTTLFCRF